MTGISKPIIPHVTKATAGKVKQAVEPAATEIKKISKRSSLYEFDPKPQKTEQRWMNEYFFFPTGRKIGNGLG